MYGRQRGMTLLELVLTTAILAILAASAMPMFQVSVRREREIELRRALREIRRGIDAFHLSYVASGGATSQGAVSLPGATSPAPPVNPAGGRPGAPGAPGPSGPQAKKLDIPLIDVADFDPVDSKGYPPELLLLVEGVQGAGTTGDENLVKFLRRVPLDPMIDPGRIETSDENFGWGARSYQDSSDATSWGRQNVYDVYSKSGGTALDGTKYKDW